MHIVGEVLNKKEGERKGEEEGEKRKEEKEEERKTLTNHKHFASSVLRSIKCIVSQIIMYYNGPERVMKQNIKV